MREVEEPNVASGDSLGPAGGFPRIRSVRGPGGGDLLPHPLCGACPPGTCHSALLRVDQAGVRGRADGGHRGGEDPGPAFWVFLC